MALPILDGNQSATTLSTILSGGEHTPAHTVVSLGSTAISNITSAVSGSVVSVSNFPATQTIAGTVTVGNVVGLTDGMVSGFESNFSNSNAFKVDIRTPDGSVLDGEASVPVQGTVTASLGGSPVGDGSVVFGVSGADVNAVRAVIYSASVNTFGDDAGAPVDSSNPLPISGTVTANLASVKQTGTTAPTSAILLGIKLDDDGTIQPASSSYPVPADVPNISGSIGLSAPNQAVQIGFDSSAAGSFIAVNDSFPLPISGTVTVGAVPNGSLTTRFGTPTTASVAFATSAVTNANRKYLLIQNVTTGSNVITVGIGFTPTTTQGIQLTAGAGITFESSYIPTGAVYVLSSVTASNFTVLEA